MRTFIAVDIKNQRLLEALEELARTKADIKVVTPENLHMTLKFLGEIPEDKAEAVATAMERCLEGFGAFDVVIRGLGAFPTNKRPRVIWAGFAVNGEKFVAMNKSLEEKLSELGVQMGERFHPHLTLARARSARGKEELVALLERWKNAELGDFRVEKVELKKSTLTPKGPIYSTLREAKL